MISQYNIGKRGSVAEYNANNAWLYNGNNGNVNNNNKYNSNGVRPVLESYHVTDNLSNVFVPLEEWYKIYRICKKNCSKKTLHLRFRADFAKNVVELCHDVGMMEYVAKDGICFTIEKPALREVIAADFTDKMVQTWYCEKVMPMLEARYLHPDSYACRVGKGGLRAVLKLQDYIFEASNGYTTDVWLAKYDFKGFFMSIDTKIATDDLNEFIIENTKDDQLRQWLLWMTRIIYLSQPQEHCRMQSPMWMEYQLPEHKRMLGKTGYKGVAIGNKTSQMLAAFRVTFFLLLLVALGYKFVHYTDDGVTPVVDKSKWLADRRRLAEWVKEKGLTLHPAKVYLQHYSKGVEMLGYKLRFDRMLPSDRIVHNFKWKTKCTLRKAAESVAYRYGNAEHFMQTVNSYLGLLGWCNSYRLRREVVETIKESVYVDFYTFAEDYSKITLKTPYKRVTHFVRLNSDRKNKLKSKSWLKS